MKTVKAPLVNGRVYSALTKSIKLLSTITIYIISNKKINLQFSSLFLIRLFLDDRSLELASPRRLPTGFGCKMSSFSSFFSGISEIYLIKLTDCSSSKHLGNYKFIKYFYEDIPKRFSSKFLTKKRLQTEKITIINSILFIERIVV